MADSIYRIPNCEARELLSSFKGPYPNDIDHLELLEGAGVNSTGYHCVEHAFNGQPWFTDAFDRWQLVGFNGLRTLKDNGLLVVGPSESFTHIGYLEQWDDSRLLPRHYAVAESRDIVTSKFGDRGPVYRHNLRHVPHDYGEFIVFLEAR